MVSGQPCCLSYSVLSSKLLILELALSTFRSCNPVLFPFCLPSILVFELCPILVPDFFTKLWNMERPFWYQICWDLSGFLHVVLFLYAKFATWTVGLPQVWTILVGPQSHPSDPSSPWSSLCFCLMKSLDSSHHNSDGNTNTYIILAMYQVWFYVFYEY